MTPAIILAKKKDVSHRVHEYSHDPAAESYGIEAATKLGIPETKVFKTLVVRLDGKDLSVAVIPVACQLSMKLFAKSAGAKRAVMAEKADVERATGYVIGGVSPLGQRSRLKTLIDISAEQFPTIYVSAGRRGLEIELSPDDLRMLVGGNFAEICQ
jgi:Cys-tRNA(Pro)/Cys-tRNA(Cys) deacylase